MDYQNTLKQILSNMRQKAASEFCQMLRDIADELECESEPFEEMQEDSITEMFDAVWLDR